MDSHADREQALKDLVETNRALVREVRAIREYVDTLSEQQRRFKRNRVLILLIAVGATLAFPVTLVVIAMFVTPVAVPSQTEDPWQRYERQLDWADRQFDRNEKLAERTDRQLDRNEKLAERTDALLQRWEKVAPKE